jgi:hypothetical protein
MGNINFQNLVSSFDILHNCEVNGDVMAPAGRLLDSCGQRRLSLRNVMGGCGHL